MNIDRKKLVRASLAMQEAVQSWIYDPNVTMIDFGWPLRSGELMKDELAIRFHVIEKFPSGPALEAARDEGRTRASIPKIFQGFPTDVPQGIYKLQQFFNSWWWWKPRSTRASRADPMKGGISISDAYRNIYGTLGGLVKDRKTGKPMILSNWHVLAGSWYAQSGEPIYQPGRGDGGTAADTVAEYSRHAMSSGLDAAVAELTGSRTLINNQFDLGPVTGVGWAEVGMEVVKSGRRTEITYGIVTGVDGIKPINYNGVDRLIRNVVTIDRLPHLRQVSAAGDSGSLWLQNSTKHAVGLHFAGMDQPERALAIDIQAVLEALNVNMEF